MTLTNPLPVSLNLKDVFADYKTIANGLRATGNDDDCTLAEVVEALAETISLRDQTRAFGMPFDKGFGALIPEIQEQFQKANSDWSITVKSSRDTDAIIFVNPAVLKAHP